MVQSPSASIVGSSSQSSSSSSDSSSSASTWFFSFVGISTSTTVLALLPEGVPSEEPIEVREDEAEVVSGCEDAPIFSTILGVFPEGRDLVRGVGDD